MSGKKQSSELPFQPHLGVGQPICGQNLQQRCAAYTVYLSSSGLSLGPLLHSQNGRRVHHILWCVANVHYGTGSISPDWQFCQDKDRIQRDIQNGLICPAHTS